ncbi:hypothetical protein BYT27DRAFT_7253348 [Phlegmacium glaucopus]|nr:hypothetical protein BYT27DRAFT_7253348 [Phlegmacium glaucopus]
MHTASAACYPNEGSNISDAKHWINVSEDEDVDEEVEEAFDNETEEELDNEHDKALNEKFDEGIDLEVQDGCVVSTGVQVAVAIAGNEGELLACAKLQGL